MCINEKMSKVGSMLTRVHQGSILGPILFLIYTVDLYYLLESLETSFQFYAEDTQFHISIDNISDTEGNLRIVHDAVSGWMLNRKLKLSPTKTEFLIISPPRSQLTTPESLMFGGSLV